MPEFRRETSDSFMRFHVPENTDCCSKLLAVAYKRPELALRSEDTEHVTGTGREKNGKFEVFIEMNIHGEVL